jgi:hypothetical protein
MFGAKAATGAAGATRSAMAVLAGALTVCLAGAASADQVTGTIRGEAVNGRSLNATQTSNARGGSVAASRSEGAVAVVEAEASTRPGGDPRAIASTQTINVLNPLGAAGTSFALMSATATFEDLVTVSGPADQIGQRVRISNALSLTSDFVEHSQGFDRNNAAPGANMTNEVEVHVSGSGVQSGVYGGSLFGAFDSTFDPTSTQTITDPTIDLIGFNMDFVIGEATPVFITLQTVSNSILADPNGRADEFATLIDTFLLRWGQDTQITLLDNLGHDTGRTPRGLTVASATGAGFFDALSTGVPEPAGWALMIAGFGLAGTTLRQRRRAALAG